MLIRCGCRCHAIEVEPEGHDGYVQLDFWYFYPYIQGLSCLHRMKMIWNLIRNKGWIFDDFILDSDNAQKLGFELLRLSQKGEGK